MNKFYMNGKLIHKASDHNTKRCEVEKWVFLPHSDFERLKANPYQEHEAIIAARDLMYEDKNAYHCIMLLDEYGDDGLLIEAEGFDYPRLSMFVPDAKSIYERYQTSESELKLHDMIKDTVEKISELAHTGKTDFTSADMIDMDEVESLVKDANVIHDNAQPYEYYEESPAYVQDLNVIDKSIKVAGDVVISGTTFEGDCYIIADGNITYNVNAFNSTGRVFLYICYLRRDRQLRHNLHSQ